MNTEFTEIVRDSMDRFTAEAEIPPGMVDRAFRSERGRRRARAGWLMAATAAASAAAAVIATVAVAPVARHGSAASNAAQLTARVVGNIRQALTRADSANPIVYSRYVGPPATVLGLYVTHVQQRRDWYGGTMDHVVWFTPEGRLALAQETTFRNGTGKVIEVSYQHRTWWRSPDFTPRIPRSGCELVQMGYLTAAQWSAAVRKLLTCSNVQVEGRQRLGGIEVIRLRLHGKSVGSTCKSTVTRTSGGKTKRRACISGSIGWGGTMFVNAATYLPVRFTEATGRVHAQLDVQWLPRTKANLAKLRLVIPRGFRQIANPRGY